MAAETASPKSAFERFGPANLYYHARRQAIVRLGRSWLERARPELAKAIRVFEAAGFRQGWTQVDRVLDLEHLLNKQRPTAITELGSGLSTVVFGLYIKRAPGVALVSFEESDQWIELTGKAMRAAGLDGPLPRHVGKIMLPGEQGCHYAEPIPDSTSLLYVDGPANSLSKEVSVPCLDAVRAWDADTFPQTIAFDLRFSTIDALRAHESAINYVWSPARRYCDHSPIPGASPRIGPHTLATRTH